MPGIRRFFLLCLSSLILLVLFVSLFLGVHSSSAQSTSIISLSPPDTSDFPHLTAYLDVHDSTGAFVHHLSPQDVTILENNQQLPISELNEETEGVQFVLAIAAGEPFVIRDAEGINRYQLILQRLLAGSWADQPAGSDDLSLITMGGPQVIHTNDPAQIKSSLESYKPDDPTVLPTLEVLISALQVASDPVDNPAMERAILFVTPPQSSEVSLGLQSIIASAAQQNIRIFTLMVASPEVFEFPQAALLRNLAEQTHAAFYPFNHDEPIPDLETLLEPLHYVYQLGYDSKIAAAGLQQVSAQVMVAGEQVTAQPQSFEMNLSNPAAAFVMLPSQITRSFTHQPTPGATYSSADLFPSQQEVNIHITFPDGYDRAITKSSLFVDGAPYAQNTAEPFDQFTWDLSSYTEESTHTLSVEVVDVLGMVGSSKNEAVRVTVPDFTQTVMVEVSRKPFLLIGVIVSACAAVLFLALVVGGRIQPKLHPGQVRNLAGSTDKTRPSGYKERMKQKAPVPGQVKSVSLPSMLSRPLSKAWWALLPWLKKKEAPVSAIASLLPLVGSDEPTLSAPLHLTADEIVLGRDAVKSNLVISDPSIEAAHARLRQEGTTFLITDLGSVAGTWVNYKEVPASGLQLSHADIIHLGSVGFRFNLAEPGQESKIVITPVEPNQ